MLGRQLPGMVALSIELLFEPAALGRLPLTLLFGHLKFRDLDPLGHRPTHEPRVNL